MTELPKKHACSDCGVFHWDATASNIVRQHHMVCAHCSKPIFYEYVLKAEVWALTDLGYHDGVLHLQCVEARINRKLTINDFDDTITKQGQSINDAIRWALRFRLKWT